MTPDAHPGDASPPSPLAPGGDLLLREAQMARAYVLAVAAAAGYAVYAPASAPACVTLGLGAIASAGVRPPLLEVVLKTARRPTPSALPLLCPLTTEEYDVLRDARAPLPRLLLVLELPTDRSDWLQQSAQRLVLRRGCYWHSLRGRASGDPTSERGVFLSPERLFTVRSLRHLMERVSAGGHP